MSVTLTEQIDLPVYNIKAISNLVGLLPVTLRAWERRYGLLNPTRGGQGYRMYSERDLKTLRWIKTQVDSGMSISRAVEYLKDLQEKGMDPTDENRVPLSEVSVSIDTMNRQLFDAVTGFDDATANEVLRRAFAIYSVDQVLTRVVQPTLVEIGEKWQEGNLSIASEHYASQFFLRHLMSMLTTTMPPTHFQTIIAAGAPGEEHQIGLLILVVMMRWRGWDIKYIGPNLPLNQLPESLSPLQPNMLLFSATTQESARALLQLDQLFDQYPETRPIIIFGGQGFASLEIPPTTRAHVIHDSPVETVKLLENLLGGQSRNKTIE